MTALRRHLTIRNLPGDVARALERERKRRGTSLNATIVELLRVAVGCGPEAPFDNGLGKHAGGWTEKEHAEFERNTRVFERIDFGALRGITTIIDESDELLSAGGRWSVE